MFDAYEIRNDFPSLGYLIDGKRNTYLDTAASAQKPLCVLNRIDKVYKEEYANVHRGNYWLSEQSTLNYENARKSVARFVNAKIKEEIIFFSFSFSFLNLKLTL